MIETSTASYPFIVGTECIEQFTRFLPRNRSKILIVTDATVAKHHLSTITAIVENQEILYEVFVLPAGEEAKSFQWLEKLLGKAIEAGLDRSSLMIALGGGVVGDVTGFAAAVYMRGIPYIQIPTTVLAHDSSIGGKVAINHDLGKNMIGSFHHPIAVLFDTSFLLTLTERDYTSGFAEMIKHAIIYDASFFSWLEEHVESLLQRDLATLEEALFRSVKIKAAVIKDDEREWNVRMLLNYGHTIGHALEIQSDYQLLHGEAVALGMVAAAMIANRYLHYEISVPTIIHLLQAFKLPTVLPVSVDGEAILEIMFRDKKARAGELVMVFPDRIGSASIHRHIDRSWIKNTLLELVEG